MSKLRINPRGKGNTSSESLEDHNKALKPSSKPINESLDYFLDKDIRQFTKGDLDKFECINKEQMALFLETSKKVTDKLFAISKILIDKNIEAKSVGFSEDKKLEITYVLPVNFRDLEDLIIEVKEDDYQDNLLFISTLLKDLIEVDKDLSVQNFNIDKLYESLSAMLQHLQIYNITQQKYIYRTIANIINKKIEHYNLISPEDGNFVDPKFHKIVSGNGQRIVRGLTYILLDKKNDEVLKFGNVKTI